MHSCDHCGESFDDEETYFQHLHDEHRTDLGPIEERKVAHLDDDGDSNLAAYLGVAGALAVFGAILYFGFFAGGGTSGAAAKTPHSPGSVHYHGPINVTVDGQTVDFSRAQYQLQDDHFHFEAGNGDRWHVHSQGVTLGYAMRTLDIELGNESVTFGGSVYRDSDPGTNVTIRVDGEPVDPASYVLREGDTIRITARTTDSA